MAAAWDAFISYARAESQHTAIALQRGLERFARPWHQRRAVRIFRDDSAMSTNPSLWSAIEEGLTAAGHLIVVLSPAARNSAYVDKEVAWWLEHKGPGSVLLVLDAGELAWDEAAGRFTADSAVPPSLRDAFPEEPRWLDLRWSRDSPSPAADPRFAAALADLSAPLRGVPRDELVGEDLTQHRRVRRLARSAVTLLVVLLAASVVSTVLAVRQRDDVLRQAVTLRSRELAAASSGLLGSDLRLAQLLAVQGYRTEASPATREALLQAAFASPLVDGFVSFGAEITSLATSADGSTVAVGLAGGEVYTVPADGPATPVLRATLSGSVTAIRTSSRGDVLLVAAGDQVSVWDRAGLRTLPGTGSPVSTDGIALSASGGRAAIVRGEETVVLTAYDTATGQQVASHPDPLAPEPGEPAPYPRYTQALGFIDEDTLQLVGNDARWLRVDLESGRTGEAGSTDWAPSSTLYAASERADYLLSAPLVDGGAVQGWPLSGGPPITAALQLNDPLDLAISPDAGLVLVNDSSTGLSVAPVRKDDALPVVPATRITGLGPVTGMGFLAPTRAVAASRSELAFLSFGGHGRGARSAALAPRAVGSVSGYAVDWRNSRLAISPDGSRLAVLELTDNALQVAPLPGRQGVALASTGVGATEEDDALFGPLWIDDTTVLVVGAAPAASAPALPVGVVRWNLAARPGPDGDDPEPIAGAAGAGTVLIAGSDGTVHTRALPDGDARGTVRAGAPGAKYDLASFSADLRHVALVSSGDVLDQPAALRVVEVETGVPVHERAWPTGTGIAGVEFAGSTLLVSRLDGSVEVLPDLGRGAAGRLSTAGVRTSSGSVQRYAPVVGAGGLVGVPTRSGLQLYDLSGPHPAGFLAVPPGFEAVPRSYVFAPDGHTLVTGYFGADARTAGFSVRDLAPEAAASQACRSAGGALSEAQWSRVIGGALPEELACR